jgi:myosin-light-chain kinase
MGENDNDTYANINRVSYDFEDEAFTDISDEAKDFISKLLIKNKEYLI